MNSDQDLPRKGSQDETAESGNTAQSSPYSKETSASTGGVGIGGDFYGKIHTTIVHHTTNVKISIGDIIGTKFKNKKIKILTLVIILVVVALLGLHFGVNQPPNISGLMPTPYGPRPDGINITWTATASDSDNDPLLYKFQLSGPSTGNLYVDQQNWSPKSEWIWEPNRSDIGTNFIRVWVKDEKHEPSPISMYYIIANKALADGEIIYTNITEMNLGKKYRFRTYIAMNDSIEAARRKITTDTDFEEKSVPILNNSFDDTRRDIQAGPLMDHTSLTVTPRMRAVLTGDYALKVSRLYPDSPYILNISVDKPGHNYGFWLWTVTPTQEGTHLLWLIAEEVLENGEVTFIESVEIPIEVIVNPETGPVEAEEAVAEAEAAVEEAEAEVEEAEAEQAAENATETVPGFGSIFALTGLLAVAYLVLGRKH